MTLSAEEIEKNWNTFVSFVNKIDVERVQFAIDMVDSLAERLATAPASSRAGYHNAFPGGLVDHSLRVLGNGFRLMKAFDWPVKRESLIIACLFHDLGKVGDVDNDLYLPQPEQWRADKNGELYVYNQNMQFMTVPDRGIFLCQHFGLRLTADEMLAIKLNDGQYVQENIPYRLKEPLLADVVHIADVIATKQEKGILP